MRVDTAAFSGLTEKKNNNLTNERKRFISVGIVSTMLSDTLNNNLSLSAKTRTFGGRTLTTHICQET